jgi:drug/metabolite transporter (DMT)-like permease
MSGWIFVLLSSASSVLIAHLLKSAENRNLKTVRVLTVNYLVAASVAFTTSGAGIQSAEAISESAPAIALAAAVGVIFIANFFIYSKSAFHNGLGISVAAMRISLILPVLLSTLWYMDILTTAQWIGVLLVFVTLFLLLPNKRKMVKEPFSAAWLLVLLFLGTGFGDASLKIYEEDFAVYLNKEQFMGYVFLTAFLIGLAVAVLRSGMSFTQNEVLFGAAIGIPNLYSAIFLIEALERMNGAVVYSSVNILTVVGATILGILIWGDRLTRLQWTGIALTLISILLLI